MRIAVCRVLVELLSNLACSHLAWLQVKDRLQEAKVSLKDLARQTTGGGASTSSTASGSRPGSAGSTTEPNPPPPAAAPRAPPPAAMAPPSIAAAGRGRGAAAYNPLAAAGARPAYNPLAAQQPPMPQQLIPGYHPAAPMPTGGRGVGSLPAMPMPGGRGRGMAPGRGGYRPPGLAYQPPGFPQQPAAPAYPPGWPVPAPPRTALRPGVPPPPPAGPASAIEFKAPAMPLGYDAAVSPCCCRIKEL